MELYGQQSRSIPQKIIIHLIEIFVLWFSYWILFQNGGYWIEAKLNVTNSSEFNGRRIIIFAFNIVTFFRFSYMMFFLLKRKIPLEESISVPLAFVIYYIGFSLFVLPTSKSLDTLDFIAIILFITGAVFNTGSEILRNEWKIKPENKGKIYAGGFFKYSRHINYFGDILWITAYSIITRNWFSVAVPVLLFCFFAFYNAPKLDDYLKSKYGKDYDGYANKTKMLIPFIF